MALPGVQLGERMQAHGKAQDWREVLRRQVPQIAMVSRHGRPLGEPGFSVLAEHLGAGLLEQQAGALPLHMDTTGYPVVQALRLMEVEALVGQRQ